MREMKPKGRKALRREAELGQSIPERGNSMQKCTMVRDMFEKLKSQSN